MFIPVLRAPQIARERHCHSVCVFVLLALETQRRQKTFGIAQFQIFLKKPMALNGLALGRKVVGISLLRK